MYKEVELLTTDGLKNFPMMANGATPVRFRQVFHEDLMLAIVNFGKLGSENEAVDFELPSKMAYIMNSSAERKDMNKLNLDGYYEWLEQFEGDTLWQAQNEISGVYLVNQNTKSKPKK